MSKPDNYIYIYDSTLRDGSQTVGIDFTVNDKKSIAQKLDQLKFDYIEGGWPGSNPTDSEFFDNLPPVNQAKITAFGMTCKPSNVDNIDNDPGIMQLINSNVDHITIVGKSWDFHVTDALNITLEQNLELIANSIKFIKNKDIDVTFDAEHFFDSYKNNSKYAMQVLQAALESGASWLVLCDTNGGTLPDEIYDITKEITAKIPGEKLGIHCHNDTGNAVANSLAAVRAGARQIQGTINGIGERCGNADLVTIIPSLVVKMGYKTCVDQESLKDFVKLSRFIDDKANLYSNSYAPYVGSSAFAHKAGLHVSAIMKDPSTYEHINPELVGNKRQILISKQAGRSNILKQLSDIGLKIDDYDAGKIQNLVDLVKENENKGYAYESATASFELLALRHLADIPEFFKLHSFRVIDERRWDSNNQLITLSEATAKIFIDGQIYMSIAEGNGPVNALDNVLKKVLSGKYPELNDIELTDYKVRMVNTGGTESIIRVLIETKDSQDNKWSSIGISTNLIDASYAALRDSIIYKLYKKM
ncbi:MAG: citramalate synthase [Pseudomonadota bacterium]